MALETWGDAFGWVDKLAEMSKNLSEAVDKMLNVEEQMDSASKELKKLAAQSTENTAAMEDIYKKVKDFNIRSKPKYVKKTIKVFMAQIEQGVVYGNN